MEVCALFKAILHLVLSLSLSKILSHRRDVTLTVAVKIGYTHELLTWLEHAGYLYSALGDIHQLIKENAE